jgi:hypothetical protein
VLKKLLTFALLLTLLTSITIAKDKKYLLKPSGEKTLIQDSLLEIPGEVIRLPKNLNTATPSRDFITGINDTIGYRNSTLNDWNIDFGFSGQEIMFTWFEAPDDMTIKSIGYTCSAVTADTISIDSIYVAPIGLRIIKLNWSVSQLMYYGYYSQGSYPSDTYGFKNVDPFGEHATGSWVPNPSDPEKLPPWTNNADPNFNTWDYDLWSNNGKAWPTIPVPSPTDAPAYNWLNLASTGLGEVSLSKGEIYAIVAVNEGTILGGNRTGIFATDSFNVHSWKFYQNSDTPGWVVRNPYTFDFAVIADVTETPLPSGDAYADSFEGYAAGQLVCQNSVNWRTWSGTSCDVVEDPSISTDEFALSGTNAVLIGENNDFLHQLPDLNNGKYKIGFSTYIPIGYTGYWNALQQFSPPNFKWGLHAFFNANGVGNVKANGTDTTVFAYTYDRWMFNELIVDLDNDSFQFFIDGLLIYEGKWSLGDGGAGINQLSGIDFFGNGTTNLMFLDDFSFAPFSSGISVEGIGAVRFDSNNDFVPDRLGEEVVVEGVITSPSLSSAYFSVNIEDPSGAIVVYSPNDAVTNFAIGDIIQVKGTVGQWKGLTQIMTTNADINYISTVAQPPAPQVITLAMLKATPEIFESRLLRVNNLSLLPGEVWPDTAGWSKNFMMSDGTDSILIRIDSDFNIDGNPEPTWPVDIIMNGGQYTSSIPANDGYQYLPRMYSDFINSVFYISFECDMSIEMAAARFDPMTDILSVRGNFNGWSSVDVMLPTLTNPNVFGVNIPHAAATAGESIAYKFAYTTSTGDVWEAGGNYSHTISDVDISNGYTTVPLRLFNNISMNDVVQQESMVKFVLDMNGVADSIFTTIENVFIAGANQPLHWPGGGWPDSDLDKVIFLSDDGTNGDETPGDNFWTVDIAFPIYTNTNIEYKYGANWGLPTNGGSNDNEGSGNHHVILTPTFVYGRTNDVFGVLTTQDVIDDSSTVRPETIAALRIDANNDFVPDRLGEDVLTVGTITSLNAAPNAGYSVEMQDETAGIHLWVPGDSVSNYPIGSQVQVRGVIEQYKGLTEITTTTDNITLLGNMPFQIEVVTISKLLANPEKYESKLIKVNGLSKIDGIWPDTVGHTANLTMSDGENQLKLRIDNDTDIDGNPEPTWPVDIVMFGGQYTTSNPPNDGYQYYPRMYSDFGGGNGCTVPDWTPVVYTNSTTAYGKVEIAGEPATEEDIVAAFVNDECRAVGNVVLNNGEAFVTLLIQGEAVETVSFRIFDASNCEKMNVSYTTQTNPGGTIGTPPNYLPIFGSSTVVQKINLNTGWNLISLNVTPDSTTPESIFSSIKSILNEVKGTTGTYSPSVPDFLNTLNNLEDGLAYWVKVNEATNLDVEGTPINYNALPIELKTGWNLTGYPVEKENAITNALSSIWSELEEAKDLSKSYSTSVPDFLNTLLTLVPNSGYWIKVNANTTLTYPNPTILPKANSNNITEAVIYENWKTQYYTNSETVYMQVEINDAQVSSGLVAAFIGDECRGIGNIITNEEKSYATIVINGEEESEVIFKVYDATLGEEIVIESKFDFVPGVSNSNIMLLKGNTEEYVSSLIPTSTKLYYAYPNPFNPSTEIKFDLHKDSNVKLSVYNMKGELVKVITNDKYSAGSYSYRWNGENNHNAKVSSGVYIIQFRTNNQSMSNKVILLK